MQISLLKISNPDSVGVNKLVDMCVSQVIHKIADVSKLIRLANVRADFEILSPRSGLGLTNPTKSCPVREM